MKLSIMIASLALVLGSACSKKNEAAKDQPAGEPTAAGEPAPKAAEPAAAKGRKIPNAGGLVVEAPAKWIDNGIGGAAGFHLDNDGGMFSIMETSPEEAAKDMDTWKKETEEILFQKWISADKTADGFAAVYVLDKMTMKGDDMVKDGSVTAFHVRRKIGDKVHTCSGSAADEATAKEAIDICNKIAAN